MQTGIHLIWLKGPMPQHIIQCLKSIINQHRGSHIKFWFENANRAAILDQLHEHDLYGSLYLNNVDESTLLSGHPLVHGTKGFKDLSPAIQSDIYRLLILDAYGGLYMDLDYYCTGSVLGAIIKVQDQSPEFDRFTTALISKENERGYHCNGILYAPNSHNAFIQECIKEVEATPQAIRRSLKEIGPNLVGRVQARYQDPLYHMPYHVMHSFNWFTAARKYEEAGSSIDINEILKYCNTVEVGRVAVHLWNDLITQPFELIVPEFTTSNLVDDDLIDEEPIVSTTANSEDQLVQIFNNFLNGYEDRYGMETLAKVRQWGLLVIAYCEWIYQVAQLYETKHVLLCYRDGYLPHQIMKRCKRYEGLNIKAVWMNRDIAGQVCNVAGTGKDYEPDYQAYGSVTPYKHCTNDKDLNRFKDLYKLYQSCTHTGSYLVVDLTTGFFSALEAFKKLTNSKVYGCSLFTIARSSSDSYRLRKDYKSWGHVTVTPQNICALKELENIFIPPMVASNKGGYVQRGELPIVTDEIRDLLIDLAVAYINTGYTLPTIATGLKQLPVTFTVA